MNPNGDNNHDPAEMFTRMWTCFASDMAKAGVSFDPQQAAPEGARAMRNTMIQTMNEHAQQFLRSPEFLAGMKQALDGSMAARKQLNDFLAQAQHEFQSASKDDADQVMAAIQSLETRITSGMDRLGRHIDRISARLDGLEAAADTPRPAPRAKAAKKKAAKKKGKTARKTGANKSGRAKR